MNERKELDGAGVAELLPCPLVLIGWCNGGKIATYEGDSRFPAFVRCNACRTAKMGSDEAKAIAAWNTRLSATTPPEPEPVDGYRQAFYQLAELMGLGAQPVSPAEVWEGQMLPRLKAMFKTEPVGELEAMALAIASQLYGPDFDPFTAPEHFEHCEKMASAALTAQRGLTLAKEGVGEVGHRKPTVVYDMKMPAYEYRNDSGKTEGGA